MDPGGEERRPIGRGRGRARVPGRGHRSQSPRPIGVESSTRQQSPESRERLVVRPGAGTPTGDFRQMSIEQKSRGSPASPTGPPGDRRGARRGLRSSPGEDYLVRTKPKHLAEKQGKKGSILSLYANYFKLKAAPQWTLHEYHMELDKECDSIPMRKFFLRKEQEKKGWNYIYDGTKLLMGVLLDPLPYQFEVTTQREETFKVTLVYHKPIEFGDPAYTQFYSVLLRHCLRAMDLKALGRNFYDVSKETEKVINEHRLVLWPGFVTSLRQHEQQVLLCVDTTNKVIRMDTVLQTIRQLQQNPRGNAKDIILNELRDSIVMTKYNHKTYKIQDVLFDENPTNTFECRGAQVSFIDYYKERYGGLEIKDTKQPLLLAKPKRIEGEDDDAKRRREHEEKNLAKLIPELCFLTGLSNQMRENFTLMKALAVHLHANPKAKINEVQGFMRKLKKAEGLTDHLQKWNLGFDDSLIRFDGRLLPPETIVFANQEEHRADVKADWTMAFRSKKLLNSANLTSWVIIVPGRDAGNVDNLVRTMVKVSEPLGMRIARPKEVISLQGIQGSAYQRTITEVLDKYKDLQMLFVVLPSNKPEPYGTVKTLLATKRGVLSQCFVAKNLTNKGLMSICTKVVVQMNAKLGGEPWTVKIPLKNTMVVGFDVYKGGSGPGIGAIVASISSTYAKYYSRTVEFRDSTELSNGMMASIQLCCKAFEEENGNLPERIFIFRDGVGDGQLQHVWNVELHGTQEGLKSYYTKVSKDPPKLTFIVVTKKINTRLIMDKGSGNVENPPPGTIVDDCITNPIRYDFFLVSCVARQGTVSPCAYNVIHDDSGLDPDKMQMLTYKMCHLYFNWSGTIAVPAPCQYAHKLAFLTGIAYGKNHAHEKLSKLLHFL